MKSLQRGEVLGVDCDGVRRLDDIIAGIRKGLRCRGRQIRKGDFVVIVERRGFDDSSVIDALVDVPRNSAEAMRAALDRFGSALGVKSPRRRMVPDVDTLGATLCEIRKRRGFTQDQLLAIMREFEGATRGGESIVVRQSMWSKIERGRQWPSLPLLFLFCDALNIPIGQVFE